MCNPLFLSPFSEGDEFNGREVAVLASTVENPLIGELLTIQFNDGVTLEVWPEEVREQPCPQTSPSSPTPTPSGSATTSS